MNIENAECGQVGNLGLAFDDVLLLPRYSEVMPHEVSMHVALSDDLVLRLPIISAAMDTVTESRMAIALAKLGGLGCIHRNNSIQEQIHHVNAVKRYSGYIVRNPITIHPNAKISDFIKLMDQYNYSGVPVVNDDNELLGIITKRDARFVEDLNLEVQDLMTSDNLVTVKENAKIEEVKEILRRERRERLMVVNQNQECIGLITAKDLERTKAHPNAVFDQDQRLVVAAAVGVGDAGFERFEALVRADVDAIVIDTAHGHSKAVLDIVKKMRYVTSKLPIIAGNVVTCDGASALIDAGATAIKVGVGPGSICTTRTVTGVGMAQFSAIANVSRACKEKGSILIADGGMRHSGDIVKALAVGADCVMLGSLLAGTNESPGEEIMYEGRKFKTYRGMGSVSAIKHNKAGDRYCHPNIKKHGFVPQGIEGRVSYQGSVHGVIDRITGGISAGMSYTGSQNIELLHKNAQFTRITNSGLKESNYHSVSVMQDASSIDDAN